MQKKTIELITPNSFESSCHYYERVLNAQIHPLIAFFMNMKLEQVISRYLHLNPATDVDQLKEILLYQPKYLRWAGADLFKVTNIDGKREMILIETNSCPSGQKSMPLLNEHDETGGYSKLIAQTFLPHIKKRTIKGNLAVIYDKNYMEASGYAATISELTNENVYLIPLYDTKNDHIKFEDGILHIQHQDEVIPIRAAFRYVTQKPWNRIPIETKTKILNPILGCLSGGRNKLVAAKAYDLLNSELEDSNIQINIPETIWDVRKEEVPIWLRKMGGHAVIKVPYSNAGQGVFTVTNENELEEFMSQDFNYNNFIIQSLIGNSNWSSESSKGKFYHVGTVPDKKNNIFVADIRMMIASSEAGFYPIAIYSRKSRKPLVEHISKETNTWDILGTNLSVKNEDGSWGSDTHRLLLMDRKDFNKLGLSLDDLIEAFIQTVLSVIAIDKMAQNLVTKKGKFKLKLFKSINKDQGLIDELYL